jgi:hypothetical protein
MAQPFGRYYCVKVVSALSDDQEIYAYAEKVDVLSDGSLLLSANAKDGSTYPGLLVASGKWNALYAASVWDGAAVTVEHWSGEYDDGSGPTPTQQPTTVRRWRRNPERDKMSQSLRFRILERDGFKCAKCGRGNQDGVMLEVDHILPIAKGGKTTDDNLQTLCKECNRGKGGALPLAA